MSAFGGIFLTNRGRNLQVKAQTGKPLKFTRVGIGDGSLNGSLIIDLIGLKNEKKSLPITKLKSNPDGQAVIGTTISNQDIASGFYFREIGLFAIDPDIGEILYCYGNAGTTAEYIPAGGGSDIIEKTMDIITIIGNAQNVSAVINQSMIYETPEGAQQKADQSEANAKKYTDSKFEGAVSVQTFNEHQAEKASLDSEGHVQLSDAINSSSVNRAATPNAVRKSTEQASFSITKSNKDSNGVFTTVEYKRKSNNTLAIKSVLSGGTSPLYTTRTITYYALDGVTVEKTDTFSLSYDSDGILVSEV